MAKTVAIDEDVHGSVIRKQEEICKKYKAKVKISDIINVIMRTYIDKTEECLEIKR